MVRYYFTCDEGHTFDSWFKNIAYFEEQYAQQNLYCPICGSFKITKKIMAPSIVKSKSIDKDSSSPEITTDVERLTEYMSKLQQYVEQNFTYVGRDFKEIAIKMHKGDVPKNNIYGEANGKELEILQEEGVEVVNLDFTINHKKLN